MPRIIIPPIDVNKVPPNATTTLRLLMLERYRRDLARANPSLLKPDNSPRGFLNWLDRLFCAHDDRNVVLWKFGRIVTCLYCGRVRADSGSRPPRRTPPPNGYQRAGPAAAPDQPPRKL